MKKVTAIVSAIIVCLLVGFISSRFQTDALQNWYPYLDKSRATPPGSVFSIVWIILYVCMGVSIGLVIAGRHLRRSELIVLFAVQLVLNLLWSVTFFHMRSPLAGMVVISLLLAVIIAYVIRAWHPFRVSAWLFIPYLLWVAFASYLNAWILLHN